MATVDNNIPVWSIRTSAERKEDNLPTYLIFCEDANSEVVYFNSFQIGRDIKINAIPEQKSGCANVANAVKYCVENSLLNEGEVLDESKDVHVWCVFDCDALSEDDGAYMSKMIDFDGAISTAEQHNFHVAWSNDCFELWVLLHIEDINYTDVATKNRKYYYERLTEYFKAHSSHSEELKKAVLYPSFYYKDYMKKLVRFVDIVLPILKDESRCQNAMERAKALYAQYDANMVPHLKCPCTVAYLLVEELLKYPIRE